MKNINSEKVVSLILGGPNKYYKFDNDQLLNIFNMIKIGRAHVWTPVT